MEKLVYLGWFDGTLDREREAERFVHVCERELLRFEAVGLSVLVQDGDSQVPSPSRGMTGRRPFDAMVSLWLDDAAERPRFEAWLHDELSAFVGYLVTESLYTDWGENRHAQRRTWPDGDRSPGVFSVSLLEKPDRFDYEEWLRRWYGRQSPVSEAMQPRARYVRNAVVRALTKGAPPYLGIVEEAWPSARHVKDPFLFYGASSTDELAENMRAMLASVTSFLDLPRIQTVMLSEYVLRTPPWLAPAGGA